jgi:NAD(P)-dependent dehydrogenase (short-subunit alcohol dehydrogenase family)
MSSVLITGGAKRLGSGLCLKFANKGWDVAFCYNNSEDESENTLIELKDFDIKVIKFKCDVTNLNEIQTAFENCFQNFGVPDVMVNNAGVYPTIKEINEIDDSLWKHVIDSNLSSQFYTSKVYSTFVKDNGRIVNIGSLGGHEIWKGRIPYNVSKAGVIQLTRALARELAPKISVNCICPGEIQLDEKGPDESWSLPKDRIPMGRSAYVDDIFDGIYFFATASKYITGQDLIIDGGYHLAR